MTDILENVIDDIKMERSLQDEKWGVQFHNIGWWMTILGEEFGETCEAALDFHFNEDDKEQNRAHLREELIQVAAVAVAVCEAIDETRLLQ